MGANFWKLAGTILLVVAVAVRIEPIRQIVFGTSQ